MHRKSSIVILILGLLFNTDSLVIDSKSVHRVNATQTEEREQANVTEDSCDFTFEIPSGGFKFLANGSLFVANHNASYDLSRVRFEDGKLLICIPKPQNGSVQDPIDTCDTFDYKREDFTILPNGSVVLLGELLEKGTYRFDSDGILIACASDYDESDFNFTDSVHHVGLHEDPVLIYIGKVGAGISVASLVAHLAIFCLVPTLRNLPGYNLACFSVSLLVAYAFLLIGQIKEVLGASCVAAAVLQQNFFLAAFFWMNSMAFDVWRSLRLATEKLVIRSNSVLKMRFLYYCLYSWGCPLVITGISVAFDNIESVPLNLKPEYGKFDVCWMYNVTAKGVFFMFPAFVLFVVNAVLYFLSARILFSNTFRVSGDDKQAVRLNLVLYARVAVIMGVTWLLSLVAAYTEWRPLWYASDILNSFQGLFVFLLFSCSRKVWNYLFKKAPETNSRDWSGSKNTSSSGTKSDAVTRL